MNYDYEEGRWRKKKRMRERKIRKRRGKINDDYINVNVFVAITAFVVRKVMLQTMRIRLKLVLDVHVAITGALDDRKVVLYD